MSVVDIILAFVILGGAFKGYKEGFIVSLFSLVAIILAVLGGFKLMGTAMVFLATRYNFDEKVLPYIAFGLVFLIIVMVVGLLGRLIKSMISESFLGVLDQGAGALLGMVRVTFMLSIILWIADSLKANFPHEWTANSWLHPITANFAPNVTRWIGQFIPAFKDVF